MINKSNTITKKFIISTFFIYPYLVKTGKLISVFPKYLETPFEINFYRIESCFYAITSGMKLLINSPITQFLS